MRRLSWFILLPVAVVVVVFAVSNRTPAAVDLWPLDLIIAPPLYVTVLGSAAAGFVIGGLIAWLSAGRTRSRARGLGHQVERAERELRHLRDRVARLEADAADAARNQIALPAPVSPPGAADAA